MSLANNFARAKVAIGCDDGHSARHRLNDHVAKAFPAGRAHECGRTSEIAPGVFNKARKENALSVGSPQQIIDKLLYQHELFGHQRFIGQIDIGGLPFDKVAQAIELLGTEVAPVVRREMAKASPAENASG